MQWNESGIDEEDIVRELEFKIRKFLENIATNYQVKDAIEMKKSSKEVLRVGHW